MVPSLCNWCRSFEDKAAPFERDYFDVPSDQNILEYAVRKHLPEDPGSHGGRAGVGVL